MATKLRSDAGLTLIEVLVACSLIGIMTAMAATNYTTMIPNFRVRGAALAIAGDLNQARMAAVKEARVYDYFPMSGGYQIRRDDGVGGRTVVKTVVLANEFPHVLFGHTGVSQDPYSVAITGSSPAATMTFQSDGTVDSAANFFLEIPNGTTTVQQSVTLSAAGRVRVWRRAGTMWE